MKTVEIPVNPCPVCGYLFEMASSVRHESPPDPGDVSLCLNCGAILIFDENLICRKPSAQEMIHLWDSSKWPLIQRAVLAIRSRKKNLSRFPPF